MSIEDDIEHTRSLHVVTTSASREEQEEETVHQANHFANYTNCPFPTIFKQFN